MLVAWFLSLALASGIVGATITLLVTEHRFELEAVASILVAVATLWLAITTSQSVSATQDILANDRATHSVDNTIDLIHRYMEVSIPATSTISLTPNIAASQVLMFSKATEKTR
jgi:membrane protein implicated in regulation of membrane protease activity